MKAADFRKELVKIMPGYKWTVHKSHCPDKYLSATGIQSSGSNRLSTLHVERREDYAGSRHPLYEVKSAGYGTKSPWMHKAVGRSLARALRDLQDHYKAKAATYRSLESDLQTGRTTQPPAEGSGDE